MIDNDDAMQNLENAWEKIEEADVAASPYNLAKIEEILTGQVTFKYILVTGLLGKLTNPDVHPRALQAGSSLQGAYDARSLCHKVLVTFEKTKGNLFGLSNEPFLNKPARHAEHDKNNTQLKNKRLATLTHDVLEAARKATPEEVEAMLVSCLRIGKEQAESQTTAAVDVESNYRHVTRFVRKFLEKADGGSRLAAVTGAYVTLLSPAHTVKVYNPNASDKFGKTSGDVEVFNEDDELVSAYECKHRAMNIDDIRHGIKKAKEAGIPEYVFVCAEGLADGQEQTIKQEIADASEEMDAILLDISKASQYWATALNPERRAQFGEVTATLLRDSMKRKEVANEAAELWNSLK
ncbi:restriction endonuclease, SacI family [Blastopirellula marina]|uniref:Restriction endonuclease, SacI family n=1 Tax=Blastopirellula marina TaxID=124 RepID=A0A2S8GTL0_9BACT|nr:restriction endonuclease, SacI family [Blastopirellula marina]PQO47404.1 hypothetical protein C5Y93_05000 [Blastopirellula marina]